MKFAWFWKKNKEYEKTKLQKALTLWCAIGVIRGYRATLKKRKEK